MEIPNLKNLFATDSNKLPDLEKVPTFTSVNNPDAIQQGETYEGYGKRACGKVNAQISFLTPFLQRVYHSERQRQADNEVLQQQAKIDIQKKIADKESDKDNVKNDIESAETKIKECNSAIDEQKSEIERLNIEAENGTNKEAKLKMIIGVVILLPLTLYLFMFYSSTIYSAFFRDFSNGTIGIGTAMFDPQAIPSAYRAGLGSLLFVVTAPVIFLGLGFCLHFFSIQKGYYKYLKIAGVLLVTFIFDCILAYLIGKSIYNVEAMYKEETMPDYTISMAVIDEHIWAVIFCGFVVYLIWGMVFGMAMSAYNDYSSNASLVEQCKRIIEDEKTKRQNFEEERRAANAKLISIDNDLNKLRQSLASSVVHYNVDAIKQALTQFYTGWVVIMQSLNPNPDEIDEANRMFNSTIESLKLS